VERTDCARRRRPEIFPAHAGVAAVVAHLDNDWRFSPRVRGWIARHKADLVFPARAGVERCYTGWECGRKGLPRARGGGSGALMINDSEATSSPRARGWITGID